MCIVTSSLAAKKIRSCVDAFLKLKTLSNQSVTHRQSKVVESPVSSFATVSLSSQQRKLFFERNVSSLNILSLLPAAAATSLSFPFSRNHFSRTPCKCRAKKNNPNPDTPIAMENFMITKGYVFVRSAVSAQFSRLAWRRARALARSFLEFVFFLLLECSLIEDRFRSVR